MSGWSLLRVSTCGGNAWQQYISCMGSKGSTLQDEPLEEYFNYPDENPPCLVHVILLVVIENLVWDEGSIPGDVR